MRHTFEIVVYGETGEILAELAQTTLVEPDRMVCMVAKVRSTGIASRVLMLVHSIPGYESSVDEFGRIAGAGHFRSKFLEAGSKLVFWIMGGAAFIGQQGGEFHSEFEVDAEDLARSILLEFPSTDV